MRSSISIGLALATTVFLVMPSTAWAGDHGNEHDGHGSGGGNKNHPTATTSAGAREIDVAARSFKFSPKRITIAAGEEVTINLRSSDVLHDFVVEEAGHIVAARAGKAKSGGLRIDEPGTYRFWCSLPGHRSGGMKGKIVVQ